MPIPNDNNDKNKEGANGEGGDANAGAGSGTGDDNKGAGAGGEGAGEGQGGGESGEETITIKKSDHEKLQSDLKQSNEDRDNYKTGLLRKKADERDLKGGGQGDGDKGGEGEGGGEGNANVIDEKKVDEVATAATNKVLRDASDKTAKRVFLKAHPEYIDDNAWTSLLSHLTFKGGETTHDEVMDRMDAALLEHKRSTGKLDEHLKAERERGIKEGRIQGQTESGLGAGGTGGDHNEGGKGTGTLSEKGKEMARAMHTDPEKAAKVDPLKDNVIDVIPK